MCMQQWILVARRPIFYLLPLEDACESCVKCPFIGQYDRGQKPRKQVFVSKYHKIYPFETSCGASHNKKIDLRKKKHKKSYMSICIFHDIHRTQNTEHVLGINNLEIYILFNLYTQIWHSKMDLGVALGVEFFMVFK